MDCEMSSCQHDCPVITLGSYVDFDSSLLLSTKDIYLCGPGKHKIEQVVSAIVDTLLPDYLSFLLGRKRKQWS